MKKITTTIMAVLTAFSLFAQAPQAFKYQAVVRDNTGEILANNAVSFRISILQGSPTGTAVYVETHQATTNNFGLVNLEIGSETPVTGVFADIEWSGDIYYLQIEMDEEGNENYQLMGTSQLLAVPYSLHSATTADTTRWRKNNNDLYFNKGNIGIGESIPTSHLTISTNNASNWWQKNLLLSSDVGPPTFRMDHTGDESTLGYQFLQYMDIFSIDRRQDLETINSLMLFDYGNKKISSYLPMEIYNYYDNPSYDGILLKLQQPGESPNYPFRMKFQGPWGTSCWYVGGSEIGDFQVTRTCCDPSDTVAFHIDKDNLRVGIGTDSPLGILDIAGKYHFPSVDGSNEQVLKTNGNGTLSWANIGAYEIDDLTDAKTQGECVYLGLNAGDSDDGSYNMNVGVGVDALKANITGAGNTAIGHRALYFNKGGDNTAIGHWSAYFNTSGQYNVVLGEYANYYNEEGSSNTIIGHQAGFGVSNHNKSGNVFIGCLAGFNEQESNRLYIENSSSSSPLIYGEFDNDLLRIYGSLDVTLNTKIGGSLDMQQNEIKNFVIENRTDDPPNPAVGQMWLRTDL